MPLKVRATTANGRPAEARARVEGAAHVGDVVAVDRRRLPAERAQPLLVDARGRARTWWGRSAPGGSRRRSRRGCRACRRTRTARPPRPRPPPSRRRRSARKTRPPDLSRRRAQAMPAAAQSPCPSEPVATRTQGTRGVGCPSSGLSNRRSVARSWSIAPASFRTAHRMGAAWPLESTNTSASFPVGSRGSKRISWKKSVETMSAADMQLVGWPEAASAVDSRQCRRSFWAILNRARSSTGMGVGAPLPKARSVARARLVGQGRRYNAMRCHPCSAWPR